MNPYEYKTYKLMVFTPSTWVDTIGGDDDDGDDDDDHDDGDGDDDDDDDGDHDDGDYDDDDDGDGEVMIMNHDHDDDGDGGHDDDDDDDDGCKCGATSGLDGTCCKIKKTYGMQKHCSVVYILVEIAQKILEAKHELIKVSKHFKTRTAISWRQKCDLIAQKKDL